MRNLALVSILFLSVAVTPLAAPPASAAPALWKVSDEDTTLHIFGTIHVLKPGTVWLNDEFQSVISKADRIYLEVSAKALQNQQASQALVKNMVSCRKARRSGIGCLPILAGGL